DSHPGQRGAALVGNGPAQLTLRELRVDGSGWKDRQDEDDQDEDGEKDAQRYRQSGREQADVHGALQMTEWVLHSHVIAGRRQISFSNGVISVASRWG